MLEVVQPETQHARVRRKLFCKPKRGRLTATCSLTRNRRVEETAAQAPFKSRQRRGYQNRLASNPREALIQLPTPRDRALGTPEHNKHHQQKRERSADASAYLGEDSEKLSQHRNDAGKHTGDGHGD